MLIPVTIAGILIIITFLAADPILDVPLLHVPGLPLPIPQRVHRNPLPISIVRRVLDIFLDLNDGTGDLIGLYGSGEISVERDRGNVNRAAGFVGYPYTVVEI